MTVDQIKLEAINLDLYRHVENISYFHCDVGNDRLRTEFEYKRGKLVVELNGDFPGSAVISYKDSECDIDLFSAQGEGMDVGTFHNGPWVQFIIEKGIEARKGFAEMVINNPGAWSVNMEKECFTPTVI